MLMGIKEIPASQDAFLAWMIDYERRHFSPTPAATMVIAALAQEWAEYWYPKPLQAWGEGLFYQDCRKTSPLQVEDVRQ